MEQLAKTQVILLMVIASLCIHDVVCLPLPSPRPNPHGSGWVPSGAWSSPAAFGAVNPWPAPAQTGWTDYSVGADPWATQKARYRANPAAWWASASTSGTAAHPSPSATSTTWYQRHHNHSPQPQLPQQQVQYQHGYHHGYQHAVQQQPLTPTIFQYEYHDPAGYFKQYHLEPDQPLVIEMPQVVKKKPSYASLYPWVEKPSYRPVASFQPQPHGGYAGWTRIPVLDEEGGNQWVAWVPEEFGDFVIVRKDKIKPKNKKKVEEEEEEEEPEPPKPKKKKVKTIVEEEAPEEDAPKPKKKTKTIVEEEAPEEERPRKKVKTIVEDEAPPKKTVTKVVTTEENSPPSPTTTTSDTSKVTKTEVIEEASTIPKSVSVLAPASVKDANRN
ncbi:NACHT, LRR and PYD domains-containing protein 5 [Frankliniella fusca]|uniref:NACHT, LRR and PYD domains-containing protein 5 n=1 Tax=Frankliniella fusca TaxID=407009 RepID=A0AAE1HQY1_9NEOP|nr:NACHT, LRR and PYD domains-containing protein 5 [Frankliniella fusca]